MEAKLPTFEVKHLVLKMSSTFFKEVFFVLPVVKKREGGEMDV